ncbi:unnamed protein product [Orchesella dallaii]|uniref:Uncharacterized protein n=1 Tax=Orchesella dallaii TaxID=48710 RepID=A0ABP1QXG8_9HEXA
MQHKSNYRKEYGGALGCTVAWSGNRKWVHLLAIRFQGGSHIEQGTRFFVTLVLTCISACATITLCFLGPSGGKKQKEESILLKCKTSDSNLESGQQHPKHKEEKANICYSITEPFRLLTNKHMLLLISSHNIQPATHAPPAMYNRFEMAFRSVYPTAV